MRVPYEQIFSVVEGRIAPLLPILIGNVTNDAGIPVPPELRLDGVELAALIGYDLEVEQIDGLVVVKGFYPPDTQEDLTE
jgi:hypothetical protein